MATGEKRARALEQHARASGISDVSLTVSQANAIISSPFFIPDAPAQSSSNFQSAQVMRRTVSRTLLSTVGED